MEVIRGYENTAPVQAMVFDFDGTISTLRAGWEQVMIPLMLELIGGGHAPSDELNERVRQYVDESTGIQTIYQMQWLLEQAEAAGFGKKERDVWWYKDEYNRRLMQNVSERIAALKAGTAVPDQYLMMGSIDFLKALQEKGVAIYIASGTDDVDLQKEIDILGIRPYILRAKGAPHREMNCSKEAVIRELLGELNSAHLAVIGDGKVEIQLGREVNARAIGLASNEAARRGVDPVKRERLTAAGADVITGDFLEKAALLNFLGLEA